MELLEFHPLHTPPYAGETEWPEETIRKERWSRLNCGYAKSCRSGRKLVIDAVPALYLRPIKFELLPNPGAFKSTLEFHDVGPGDGTNDDQIKAYSGIRSSWLHCVWARGDCQDKIFFCPTIAVICLGRRQPPLDSCLRACNFSAGREPVWSKQSYDFRAGDLRWQSFHRRSGRSEIQSKVCGGTLPDSGLPRL